MRRLSLAVLCALAAACSSGQSSRQLVILHTNDEHSHLLGAGPEADDYPAPTTAGSGAIKGGVARRAVVLKAERDAAAASGAATLTVSAGDNMMGTLTQIAATTASPDYRLMKMLGYDVTTLGNHEFDYGPAALATIITKAQTSTEGIPQIVSSNIHFSGGAGDAALAGLFDESGTDTTKVLHRTFVVTTSNGLKVGFVGIMGADAAAVAPLKAPVKFSVAPGVDESVQVASLAQIYTDIQPFVTKLRRDDKVDLVIALSHSGADAPGSAKGEDYSIAANVEGIDVIISGHSHTEAPAKIITRANGHQTLVQQAGRFGEMIGRIALSVDEDGKVSFDTDKAALVKIDDKIVGDPPVMAFVAGVITALEQQPVAAGAPSYIKLALLHAGIPAGALANKTNPGDLFKFPLAGSDFNLDNSAKLRETQLLTFVADAQLAYARSIDPGVELAVEASGPVRVSTLEKDKTGHLAFGDIFRAVPLGASPKGTPGYPLVITNLYFAEIKAAFEIAAGYAYTGHEDLFIVPAGYKFEYDTTRPAFNPGGDTTSSANGRVTKIWKATPAALSSGDFDAGYTLLFDASLDAAHSAPGFPGWLASPLALVKVATNLYIATFATFAGVTLKQADGSPVPGNNASSQMVVRSADNTDIKEWEAVSAYAAGQAAVNSGKILPKYAPGLAPRRAVCVGLNAAAGVCTH